MQTQIRWMLRRDLPKALEIEQASFEFTWNEEDFLTCLRQRDCIGMVADVDDVIVGFMIYELHKSRLAITNFAVAPDWRRLGIGSQMVLKLVAKLSAQRRTKITLAVRESNLAAQLFFRSLGFVARKVSRDFYEDTGEDAYLMRYNLGQCPDLISVAEDDETY